MILPRAVKIVYWIGTACRREGQVQRTHPVSGAEIGSNGKQQTKSKAKSL